MSIRFSIVIPTYNRADFISANVDSILSQEYPAHEIIVVNDGSTDNTSELVLAMKAKHDVIKLIEQENSERGSARNRGMSAASGDYILFFDSDDKMRPTYLKTLNNAILNATTPPFMVACKIAFRDQNHLKPHIDQAALTGVYDYKTFLQGNPLACHYAIKNDPEIIPFEDDRSLATMEDWIFLVRNTYSNQILIVDSVEVEMTIHAGRSMNNNSVLVQRRKKATDLLIKTLSLTAEAQRKIWSYSHLFCLVHSVDDRNFQNSLKYAYKCISRGLLNRVLTYSLIRLFLGNKLARMLTSDLSRTTSNK